METYEHGTTFPSDSETASGTVTPLNRGQRKAVGTAAAGTAILGAAAYALSRLEDAESSEAVDVNDGSALNGDGSNGLNGKGNGNGTNGANGLGTSSALTDGQSTDDANAGKLGAIDGRSLDEMTFDEAFAAARHAMGKGHHFTWHGGLYNTFYTEELDAMSLQERLAFVDTLGLDPAPKPAQPVAHKTEHHQARHHQKPHHDSPDLADNHDHSPTIEPLNPHPITVVPMALASAEVVPLPTDQQNAHQVDLITGDNTTDSQHEGVISPAIESVDNHHDQNHADAHHSLDHDSSDDDDQVNFMY